jgi:hypothetical protein
LSHVNYITYLEGYAPGATHTSLQAKKERKKRYESRKETRGSLVTPYSNKMAYIKEKIQFHPVRHFRLDDETYKWLKKIKRGTWNFNNIKKKYGNEKLRRVSGEQVGNRTEEPLRPGDRDKRELG